MNNKSRKAEYLAKAKEAEEYAAKAKDIGVQENWKNIAASYRELAKSLGDD